MSNARKTLPSSLDYHLDVLRLAHEARRLRAYVDAVLPRRRPMLKLAYSRRRDDARCLLGGGVSPETQQPLAPCADAHACPVAACHRRSWFVVSESEGKEK